MRWIKPLHRLRTYTRRVSCFASLLSIALIWTLFGLPSLVAAVLHETAVPAVYTLGDTDAQNSTVDTAALNRLLEIARKKGAPGQAVYVPCGVHVIDGMLDATRLRGVRIYGAGDCSILRIASSFPNHTNLLDLSESRNVEVDHLAFDMRAANDPASYGGTVIFGGPQQPSRYGGISIHNVRIYNNNWQAIGVGTSHLNAELHGLLIADNRVEQNACQRNRCGNGIDTGSIGTRRHVIIRNNVIVYPWPLVTQIAPGEGGDGIFCGHGLTTDFQISGNVVRNSPGDGIQVYARPFNKADPQTNVAAHDYVIQQNRVTNSGRHGIAIYGGTHIDILENLILNPGSDPDGNGAQGISITFGIRSLQAGNAEFPSEKVEIHANIIQDRQAIHHMQHGINLESKAGTVQSAAISGNQVEGAISGPIGHFEQ